MTPLQEKLFNILKLKNPYLDFDHLQYKPDIQGWGSIHPLFAEIISQLKPQLILEIGSWKGASAIHIANLLQQSSLEGVIICIDTWLGGIDNISDDPISGINAFRKHGYPTLYYQFLANIVYAEKQDYIIPFPNTSITVARYLQRLHLQADFIYVDGSHEEDDVYADITHYWSLLRKGGVMMGDDWNAGKTWYGVICAVNRFVKDNQLNLILMDEKWVIQK